MAVPLYMLIILNIVSVSYYCFERKKERMKERKNERKKET